MIPRFSIAIPVFNRRDYLRQAVQSCLAQTELDLEIVVSDDASSEALESVAEGFNDARVRYSRSAVRLGAVRNHARAVALCRGAFVLTLNSDDMLLPQCLRVAAQALDQQPEAAAAYFSMAHLKGNEVSGLQEMPGVSYATPGVLRMHPWLEKFHGTSPSCCLFRRSAFERLGGYRTSLKLAYDWDLYMRFLTQGGGVVFIPLVLAIYRLHPEQMVSRHSLDGLTDMLQLWSLDEYAHFSEAEMAELALSHVVMSVRARSGLRSVLREMRTSGHLLSLLRGAPAAVLRRLWHRAPSGTIANRYLVPSNAAEAMDLARVMIGS